MKKLLISLPLLLMFITSLTFARSNRFDSNIYNQCVQYYQTQRHNAETQAGNLGFSKRGVEYLNSLPTDEEIEEQCEYNAENRQDDDTFYRWQNLGYQATLNGNYDDAISYYEKALYYVPVGSQMYNAVESVIEEIKQYKKSSEQFNKWSKYYNLGVNAVKNYNFDDAIEYFEDALEYTNVGSQEYYDTQSLIQNAKNLKKQQDDIKRQEQASKNWEQGKKYFELGEQELKNLNFDQAIYYFEKSLDYVEKGSETYTKTKDLINTIKDTQKAIKEDTEKQDKETKNNNEKTSTTTNTNNQNSTNQMKFVTKDEVLLEAIQWMYNNGLTIYNTPQEFLPNDEITREQASKFFVEFAAKVLGKDRGTISNYNIFSDLGKANPTLKDHIIYANNMGLFKGSNGKFNPFNKLTKAQAIAVTVRMANGYMDENTKPRYINYYYTADIYGLLRRGEYEFDTLDSKNISRGDMALILYSLYNYLNNN